MPNYSNTPPADGRGPAFSIRRTPTRPPLSAIVTSEDLLGCATHFYGGRTIPCEAPDCPACLDQMPWRWHGYVAAIDLTTMQHFIFETTAQAADVFVAYRARHGTLRGCQFEAKRAHERPNGRVLLRCKPADLQRTNLPQAPDIPRALNTLWNITKPNEVLRRKPGKLPTDQPDKTKDGNNHPVRIMDGLDYQGRPIQLPDPQH